MTAEEIQQIFFAECEESLAAAETGLAACMAGTQDADTVNAVFRAVHSIKGGAGAFGFTALQAYAHGFEAVLSDLRDGSLALSDALVDLLLRALDLLGDHVAAARAGSGQPDDAALLAELTAVQAGESAGITAIAAAPEVAEAGSSLDAMLDDLFGTLGDSAAGEPACETERWLVHVRPHAGAMANGSEPMLMLRELAGLGGACVACDVSQVPPLDSLDPAQGHLGWTFAMPGAVDRAAVEDVFAFVGEDCSLAFGEGAEMPPCRIAAAVPAAPDPVASPPLSPSSQGNGEAQPAASTGAAAGQSIRIDLAKLDRLIDTVGELVIAQAMVTQRLMEAGGAADEELGQLEALTRDIQESAMSIRAQPIGNVFNRVPRILRELAASTGKHVRIEMSGEATEVDKTVIERLGEPLTHLIRNAVDHGIESAEERLAAGKEAEGTLTLSAEQRSGRILVRIADDGKGIDRARVLAKAVAAGLVPADASLAPEEIDNLIFAPGFSTAASVTSVSGRGVGMDVVRQNVKELGGRIAIESEAGKGTTFTLTLPLTLAISDGMIVAVEGEKLVVPLAHVVECLKPEGGEIQGCGRDRMINMRGRFIPIVSVREAMGKVRHGDGAGEEAGGGVVIVVDTEAAGKAALLVDEISDQRQFVIKSLDTHFHSVPGVAGATILGDGKVALILDVDGLVAGIAAGPERQAA